MVSDSLFTDNSTFTTIGNDRSYTTGGTLAQFNQIGAAEGSTSEIYIESFTIDITDGEKILKNGMMALGTPLQVKVAL
jgi:hypothetical protein